MSRPVLFQRMLVATDLSHSSLLQLMHVAALARRLELPVSLVHVERLRCSQLLHSTRWARVHQLLVARRPAALEQARASLDRAGAAAVARMLVGEPAEAILSAVKPGDLLVLGRRGLRRETGLPLGATTLQVLRCLRVPALVVPGLGPDEDLPVEPPAMDRVLATGTPSASRAAALRAARALAARLGAEVEAVHMLGQLEHLPRALAHMAAAGGAGLVALHLRDTAQGVPCVTADGVLRWSRVPVLVYPPEYLARWGSAPQRPDGGVDLAA